MIALRLRWILRDGMWIGGAVGRLEGKGWDGMDEIGLGAMQLASSFRVVVAMGQASEHVEMEIDVWRNTSISARAAGKMAQNVGHARIIETSWSERDWLRLYHIVDGNAIKYRPCIVRSPDPPNWLQILPLLPRYRQNPRHNPLPCTTQFKPKHHSPIYRPLSHSITPLRPYPQ